MKLVKKSATYRRFTVGGPSSCYDTTTRCLDVTLTDVLPDAAHGAADARPEGGVTADGGPARCCPADPAALSGLDAGVDGWSCAALGGADLGGCYKTCRWACPDTHVVARLGSDARGCEMWVPEPAGAKPPFCLPYQ